MAETHGRFGAGPADELATSPVFADLRRDHLQLLAGCCVNVAFAPGQRILTAGDPADRFWLVRHGLVDIELHDAGRGTLTIDRIGPGDLLGVSWIAAPYVWEFDATAVERGSALRVDAACLRAKCAVDHDLGHELYRRFAGLLRRRLTATRIRLLDVYGDPGAR